MFLGTEVPQQHECRIEFPIWWIFSELLLAGVPWLYLTRVKTGFRLKTHQEESDRSGNRNRSWEFRR
jgi:hypothetical protein